MVTKKTEKKKTIANVVKTIIKKSPAPARKSASASVAHVAGRKTEPPIEGAKSGAIGDLNENIEPQPPLSEQSSSHLPENPKKDRASFEALKLKEPTTEEISMRAYLIWEREGRPSGCSDRHWQQAMQELQSKNNK